MTPELATYSIAGLGVVASTFAYQRAYRLEAGAPRLMHSRPVYHASYVLLCVVLPAIFVVLLGLFAKELFSDWMVVSGLPDSYLEGRNQALVTARLHAIAGGEFKVADVLPIEQEAAAALIRNAGRFDLATALLAFLTACVFGWASYSQTSRAFRARNHTERISLWLLCACSAVAILTTLGIVFTLVFDAARFFMMVSPIDFFFGMDWRPIMAIREDQSSGGGAFGIIPVLSGSLLIAAFAMAVAAPVGLLSAIYMVEFARPSVRSVAKPAIEVLAGIPTVVYGFFAVTMVAPYVRDFGEWLGVPSSSESALAAGAVMGIMVIPFVSSLSDDVINAVPGRLREAAYSLGATKGETILKVVLPAALPGLLSAMVLAMSRAIGETMIVVMAAGLAANMTLNPFEAVTTITVQITTVLTGDQPFDSPMTLSAFALALTLFILTLALNLFALKVMQKYREKYE
ncbi:MAG: phosphate ABC transporter permease subunit PstC [Pseudomonadota bacterium]